VIIPAQPKSQPQWLCTLRATCSSGSGEFQVFLVELSKRQLETLPAAVPHTLHPRNESETYRWQVNDGVTLFGPNTAKH